MPILPPASWSRVCSTCRPEYLKGIRPHPHRLGGHRARLRTRVPARGRAHTPALNNFGSAVSIIQDELAHAHIGYRLLGDLGVDMPALIYEREASAFKYPYAFDVPLDSWYELVLANALYDPGHVRCSSATCTVPPPQGHGGPPGQFDKEETFHLRHGRTWVKKFAADPDHKAKLQASLDWMFIFTLEWFGLPDAQKRHGIQLEYGFKGKTNDELRQDWMGHVVPFMDEVGLRVPAHFDEESQRYVIDCPFPQQFDSEKKQWGGVEIGWDEVIVRWKGRGPMNETYVAKLQKGYRG